MINKSPELSECNYCGEIEETRHMNLITENGEEKKMCCDCAEEYETYYRSKYHDCYNQLISKTN